MSQSSLKNKCAFELTDRLEILEMWHSRFGILPLVFEGYSFYKRGRNIWIFSQFEIPDLRSDSVGLRFLSTKGRVWKPSTYALQLFGRFAIKNVVDLAPNQAKKFIAGYSQILDADLEDGYVVVSYLGDVLGCGLYKSNQLKSQLPKERRIAENAIVNPSLEGESI